MKTPLESMLSIKRWNEDEAKQHLALARKALAAEEDRLKELEGRYLQMQARSEVPVGGGVDIETLQRMQLHLDHLAALIKRQQAAVAEHEGLVELSMKLLAEASTERKVFEKVDERRKKAAQGERLKGEQKGADEHASVRFKKH